MKLPIFIFLLLVIVPGALAITVTRSVSTSSVTYTITGASGTYGVLIDDTITGGCTLSDGTMKIATIMMNPETTKTIPFTKGANACVFSGVWDLGTTEHGTFPDATTGTGSCVPVAVTCGACNSANKKTCTDGCAQTMQDCAGTTTTTTTGGTPSVTVNVAPVDTPTGYCGLMAWAKFFDPVNYCIVGTLISVLVIGGIAYLWTRR